MAEPAAGLLVFEQPLNERMRTFLRLDFLYSQALYHNEMASQWGSRAAMSSLIDILAIATRGDVRSDVLKELEGQLATLNEFQSKPGVDAQRLKTLMSNLVRLRARADGRRLGFPAAAARLGIPQCHQAPHRDPGGTCEFDLPDYYFWLSQPDELRMRAFNQWLALLRPLCDAIAELLWLTRQNGRTREEVAKAGTFNITFERDHAAAAAAHLAAGSRRAVSGDQRQPPPLQRALPAWNGLATRPTQTEADVPFTLTCCA